MSEQVYLNGAFLPRSEAKISPDDRGFIFADGVYEVIKYYTGIPFCYEAHMERLKYSLSQVNISFQEVESLKNILLELLTKNELLDQDAGVYIQITRGAAKRVHYLTKDAKPSIYIFTFPFPSNIENLKKGIRVITEKDIRWQRCDIKSVCLLPNVMLFDKAYNSGASETILIREGVVTEATHSSVYGVQNDTLYTHPLNNHVLPGITRKVVLDICSKENIKVIEEAITANNLSNLDEVFITGTGSEITPVVKINDQTIQKGKPGKLTKQLQKLFYKKVYSGETSHIPWLEK